MGCKASKNLNSLPQIEHNFPSTANPSLDAFFKKASDLLQKTENLRQQMFVSKQKGVNLAGTSSSIESPYTKAVEVLFWALSASKQGSIIKARVSITESRPPFAVLDVQDFCRETLDLFGTLQQYLLILMETPESLAGLVHAFQSLKDEQIELKKGIDPKTASTKEGKVIDANMKKLTDGITISAKVLGLVQEEQRNASELIQFIHGLMSRVDEVGAKAHAAGLIKPADIFKMVENEKKKAEKNSTKSPGTEKNNKGSAKIGNLLENDHVQKAEMNGYEYKPNNNHHQNQNQNQNQMIVAESVPIGHSMNYNENAKTQEFQYGQYGTGNLSQEQPRYQNGVHQNEQAYPPSFGEIKNGQTVQYNQNEGQASQGKLNFNPNQQDGNIQLNDSHSIYGHLQQKQNEDERNVPNETVAKAQNEKKKLYFITNEFSTEIPQAQDIRKVEGPGPGYLSPGGSKQAGILQGEENIKDIDEIRHPLVNETNALKGFSEKARSYLESKN